MGTLTLNTLGGISDVRLHHGDLDEESFAHLRQNSAIAWDIETGGLDWQSDPIGTVQVRADQTAHIIQIADFVPKRLAALVSSSSVLKIFHHAMFDLRFMAHHWGTSPANVACTKIASKLLRPDADASEHSLANLLDSHFGVRLDKSLRISDWTADLTAAQLAYATNDVRYLVPLYEDLEVELRRKSLLALRDGCYSHIPTRVALELGRFPDVFEY